MSVEYADAPVEFAGAARSESSPYPTWAGAPPRDPDEVAGWLARAIYQRSLDAGRPRMSPARASAALDRRYPGLDPAEAMTQLRARYAGPAARPLTTPAEAQQVLLRKAARLATMLRLVGDGPW